MYCVKVIMSTSISHIFSDTLFCKMKGDISKLNNFHPFYLFFFHNAKTPNFDVAKSSRPVIIKWQIAQSLTSQ